MSMGHLEMTETPRYCGLRWWILRCPLR